MTNPVPTCKDCIAENVTTTRKPALDAGGNPRPGNRCVTHWRAVKKVRRERSHELRVEANYGISGADYKALYASQEGRCFICQVARGISRKLAVDHDHDTGAIRGLLCGPCNLMIGRLGVRGLSNALVYLHQPPAIGVIGCKIVPSMDARGRVSTPKRAGAKPITTDGGEPDP